MDPLSVFVAHPFLVLVLIVIVILASRRFLQSREKTVTDFPPKFLQDNNKDIQREHYDVAIVGAGPAGATCAYYLGCAGRKTLLLEKKQFPRDKYCGDAVCKTAIEILNEMGIYRELLEQNKARVADNGGLVSPGGLSFVGHSKEHLGEIPAAIACKRLHLDNAIAMAAKKAGAELRENCSVSTATFDQATGLWTIRLEDGESTFRARVLVCADGAPSRLATSLGIVTDPPTSNCSRAYVEGGSHKFKADGVVFYPKKLLPGYAALFKHPNDELNYCVYIIPGNPKVTPDDLPYWHESLKKEDPFMSKALGSNFKIERMKAASLRLGGVPKSYDSHVIVVGDAAGMIDPMTGEGIHHAMEGGKMAALFLDEVITHGNYDSEVMAMWHQRWMRQFGSDFKWSMAFCQMLYRFPILLDAATAAINHKGDEFLARWADIMTGRIPKFHLLKPEFVIAITWQLLLLVFKRGLGMDARQKKTA